MPRMKHPEHGINNFGAHEFEAMEKLGWKIYTDADHEAAIAAKKKPVTISTDGQAPAPTAPAASATAPARRGRPPKG